jgi:hypothetical protein
MRKVKQFFPVTLAAICLTITSCSQAPTNHSTALASFEATTPCDEVSRSLLHIPSTDRSEMMKWNLTLVTPTTYQLFYTYGMAKQGTRGFSEGAITTEQKGKLTKSKYKNAEVYTLTADDSRVSISFLKLNENVLHLLDANKNLVVGNGAWSYTLNRINPVKLLSNETNSQKIEEAVSPDSLVFEGRMPCYAPLLALSGKTTAGCNLVKCRIVFFSDKLHAPSSLKFYSIHVGTGNTRYLKTGTWVIIHGTKTDPNSTLYQLQFGSEKPLQYLMFLKGDDNVLFLLDNEMNCMAGNDYCGFTLNRVKK